MLRALLNIIGFFLLTINFTIFSQTPSYHQAFNIFFEQDFEDDSIGTYSDDEWREDWNYPEWSNRQVPPEILYNNDIENGTKVMRWHYPEGSVGPEEGGGQWLAPLNQEFDEVYFSYRIKFRPGFEWVIGGKIPGLRGGPTWPLFEPPGWNDGFIVLLMWNNNPQITFYYYHQDLNHKYGDSHGWNYNIESGVWYTITIRIVMNTIGVNGGNNDGILEGFINDELCCQMTNLRFRNLDSIGTDHLHITSFFGGDGEEWAAIRDEWTDVDDFVVFTYKDGVVAPRGNTPSSPDRVLLHPYFYIGDSLWRRSLNILPVSGRTAELSWDSYPIPTDYEIQRKLNSDSVFTSIDTLNFSYQSYIDNDLEPLTNYEYRIKTYNVYSDTVEVVTYDTIPPDAPVGLFADSIYKRQVDISWVDSSYNETGFKIERSFGSDTNFTLAGDVGHNTTFFADVNLTPDTTYYYRVFAYNEDGNSGYTDTIMARTLELEPPIAPGGLSASDVRKYSLILHWMDNSNNEDGFRIIRSNTPGSGYIEITTVDADVTSLTNTGLTLNTDYYYIVEAFNEDGTSGYSEEFHVKTLLIDPPIAPTNLSASGITKNSIVLSWTDNAYNEDGFKIIRSNTSGNNYLTIALVNANVTSFTDTDLLPNTDYYYKVRAYNTDGKSVYTAELSAITLELNPPNAPSGLSALNVSKNSVVLLWTDNANNEDGFKIIRSNTSGTDYKSIALVKANVTSYTDSDLLPNTNYYYKVKAFNEDGKSVYSNELKIKTPELQPPDAPSELLALSTTKNSVVLSWIDNADNEDGFKIIRTNTSGTDYKSIALVKANVTSYTDSDLLSNTNYYYKVKAFNEDGKSVYTNELSVKTLKPPPPDAPSGLTASNITKHSIELVWTDNSGDEDGFNIARAIPPDSIFVNIGSTDADVNTFYDSGLTPDTYYSYKVEAYNSYGNSACSSEVEIKTLGNQYPAAPAQLYAFNITQNSADLSWTDNADNEDGFNILRATSTDSGFVITGTVSSDVNIFHDEDLTNNTYYYYKVEAFNNKGKSGYSNKIKIKTAGHQTPLSPFLLSVNNITKYSVTLSWSDKSGDEDGFEIQRSTSFADGYIQIGSVPANITSFIDKGLTPNTAYYYKLRAFKDGEYSGFSNIMEAKTKPLVTPNAPSSLAADTVSYYWLNLVWLDNATNESGYKIERSSVSNTGYLTIANLNSPNQTEFKDSGLVSNTTYYYRVKAYNEDGSSNYSNELKVKTLILYKPQSPTLLSTPKVTSNSITLNWQDNSNNETGFVINRATKDHNEYVTVNITQPDQTVYTDKELEPNTTYYYSVNAVNLAGNSKNSITDLATTISISESNRIWEGIVVYYNFSLISDNIIKDYSGFSTPLDLAINDTTKIRWKANNSIEVISNTYIKSRNTATKIVDACKESDEITLECWIKPASINSLGMSNILAIASKDEDIGASLVQANTYNADAKSFNYSINLKTKATASDGAPSLYTENDMSYIYLQHLVYVKDKAGIEKIYLDGKEVTSSIRPEELENWKDNYYLILGNDLSGDSPWYGTYYAIAIYNTALSNEQILVNYNAGFSDNLAAEKIKYEIKISPNPSEGLFNINIIPQGEYDFIPKTMIQICDIMGTVISSDIFENPCKEHIKFYNLTDLPKGMYILRVVTNDSFSCKRFILR